jgi:hypothetical protein
MSDLPVSPPRCSIFFLALLGCPREPAKPQPLIADASVVVDAVVDAYAEDGRAARARTYWKPTGPAGKRFYLAHRNVPATIFWVGEPATKQNGCTPNIASAFDHDWLGAYGGCDAHTPRITEPDGFNRPQHFVPKENPYYFALPYGTNESAPFRDEVPWVADRPGAEDIRSAVKNRWIGVRHGDRTCYAQWEDVGPFCADDVQYVFGYGAPRNDGKSCDVAGEGNGTASALDVSPAVAHCLGVTFDTGLFQADWWFVDDDHVPVGPWSRVITSSPVRDGPPRDGGICVQSKPYPLCGK